MAKFVFKLQGVLRQRTHVEQEKQRLMAEHQLRLIEAEQSLRDLEKSLQASNDDMRNNRLVGRLDMNFIAAHRRFMGAIQRQGTSLMQKMVLIQRNGEQARAELAEAAKDRKVIEKLREKQFEQWRTEQNERELAQLDEIGMQLAYENLKNSDGAE